MDLKTHWETIYRTKQPHEVSWFQREATVSLALIRRVAPEVTAKIIDVGGGASTLVDGLVAAGYRGVTVLDLSPSALETSRRRLGAAAHDVTWLEADALSVDIPPGQFDVWHDRAVFHFLTSAADRSRYVEQVGISVKRGGYVLVATFAADGPTRCSGLPVARYRLMRCITSSDRHFDWWRASGKSTSRRPARSRHLCTASVRSNLFRRISRYDIAYRDGR